ncbi:3-deoxy-manno-octulosonate cytidylyltransferase [Kordiimonas sediminis]|uniref:3-deoxy-manno-octulosonate cytidylyltransferase n=1 Tax=Kordiimonas sediminis TaxID=1735581 RepID=A0A919E4A7_9PROT|nr:3-deoxy-manno-octulosonate cytidylyltransferase [Kordiimonas sediminis]GHF18334.1 3-deoxy-manno-octulosonate cytidylyltransferase [Kordiimonas sediminis]
MIVVIPARYSSSRLYGKPLAMIAGKPMIEHVWHRAVKGIGDAGRVYIATDDDRVLSAAASFGGQGIKTRSDHPSGTDRIAEVVEILSLPDTEIIVNVQGDEPMIPSDLINLAGSLLEEDPAADLATLTCPITTLEDVLNPNIVKAVLDASGYASYFSRAPVPFDRDGNMELGLQNGIYQRHIGLYAYRVETLKRLTALPPAPTEHLEQLEQLRALYNGMKIGVVPIPEAPPHGVDTQEDLIAVRRLFGEG